MTIDWYTKLVLTVIAVALVADAARDYILPARAAEVQRVAICATSGTYCATVDGLQGLKVDVTRF